MARSKISFSLEIFNPDRNLDFFLIFGPSGYFCLERFFFALQGKRSKITQDDAYGLLPGHNLNLSLRLQSVNFLAGHAKCPPHMGDPHGDPQTSPQHADPHGLGAFLWKTLQEIHKGNNCMNMTASEG